MTTNANIDRRARHASRKVDTSRDHTDACAICDGDGKGAFGQGTCRNCGGTGRRAT